MACEDMRSCDSSSDHNYVGYLKLMYIQYPFASGDFHMCGSSPMMSHMLLHRNSSLYILGRGTLSIQYDIIDAKCYLLIQSDQATIGMQVQTSATQNRWLHNKTILTNNCNVKKEAMKVVRSSCHDVERS